MVKKQAISLSTAFEELEKIARELESGELDLEEATKLYKKGLQLAGFLKKRLAKIGNEIKEIRDANLNESKANRNE